MELMDDLERRLEEGAAREEALSVKVVELEVCFFIPTRALADHELN